MRDKRQLAVNARAYEVDLVQYLVRRLGLIPSGQSFADLAQYCQRRLETMRKVRSPGLGALDCRALAKQKRVDLRDKRPDF